MKKYVLIAGVNGVGKSTLYPLLTTLNEMERINTDEIVREIGNWKNATDMIKAGKLAVQKVNDCFAKEVPFNQETTLCGKSILKYIDYAKEKGYYLELHYIGVENVEIAKDRIKKRVQSGGHGIAEEDIERRFTETFENLKIVLPKCDIATFYDNTQQFVRFAVYENGKFIWISKDVPKWFQEKVYMGDCLMSDSKRLADT